MSTPRANPFPRLPKWARWLLLGLGVLALLWFVLTFAFGYWFFNFGTQPNAGKFYDSVFVEPRSQVRKLEAGGFSWQEHDVWVRFESEFKPTLKSIGDLKPISVEGAKALGMVEKGCLEVLQSSSEVYAQHEPNGSFSKGQLWVYNPVSHRHCYQVWSLG